MRLLVLDQYSDPGGAQQVLLELLPAIRERGWHAVAGLPGQGALFERIRELGFEAEPVECGPYTSGRKSALDLARFLKGTPRLARQIEAMAKRERASLIYVNGPRLLPAAAMADFGCPVLFHAHSHLGPGATRVFTGMCLRSMRAWVVGSCRFVSDPWREYVGSERLSVIYNGVAPPGEGSLTAPSPGAGGDTALSGVSGGPVNTAARASRPTIGCIGRIAPEKGQREFLEAARNIHRAIPESRFVICGAALFSEPGALRYDAEIRTAAAVLPVEFPGWVSDVYATLAGMDLLLVPSAQHEATTRVILEAFAAGVPVIAFRSGGIPEVIEDQINAFLVDGPEEMGRLAIHLLTGDRARMAAIAQKAKETWRQRFTLEGFQRQVLGLMERIGAA